MTQDLIWEQYPYPVAVEGAAGRKLVGDDFQCDTGDWDTAARGAARRRVDQQNRLNQRLRGVVCICSGEAVGDRHPGQ